MGKQPGSAPGDAPDHLGSILSAWKAHRPSRPETGATDDFHWGFFRENLVNFRDFPMMSFVGQEFWRSWWILGQMFEDVLVMT